MAESIFIIVIAFMYMLIYIDKNRLEKRLDELDELDEGACNNLNDSSDDFPERRFLIPRLLIAGICIGTTVGYGIIVVKEIFL